MCHGSAKEDSLKSRSAHRSDTSDRLRKVVELLCSDEYQPRNTGARGAERAAEYLASEMERLGLEPKGTEGFQQPISPIIGSNVLGAIGGTSDRWVVLGAHYDACGWDNPGAGDNAAAVAVALEVAERFRGEPIGHSVLIALFDAEEPPNFLTPEMGSQWFVDHPTIPIETIDTMVCLDLVGHALGPPAVPKPVRDSILILGAEKGSGNPELVGRVPSVEGIKPRRIDSYVVPPMSDYHAFVNAGIPYLFYTCGRNEHYHMPTDTPDTLDYFKMAALVDHLVALIGHLSTRPDKPAFVRDGVDDEATVHTIRDLTSHLSQITEHRDQVEMIVNQLEGSLHGRGHLSDDERRVVAYLVFSIEEALA